MRLPTNSWRVAGKRQNQVQEGVFQEPAGSGGTEGVAATTDAGIEGRPHRVVIREQPGREIRLWVLNAQ